MEPEILVNISFRLPQTMSIDRQVLSKTLEAVLREAIFVGGDTVHFGMQPYDPEEDE